MQQQLVARLRVEIAAVIAHRIRIFLEEKQGVRLQLRLIARRLHDEIVLLEAVRRLLERLERQIIFLVVSPEIEAVPRRIDVADEQLRAGKVDVAAANDRIVVVLADDALMVFHTHAVMPASCQRLYGVRFLLILVAESQRVLVIRHAVELRAEHAVIHDILIYERIEALLPRRLPVALIERDRLSLRVPLEDVLSRQRVYLRLPVRLIDKLILDFFRRADLNRPRIGRLRPDPAHLVASAAAVPLLVVAQEPQCAAVDKPRRAVFVEC